MRRVIKSVLNHVPFSERLINSAAFYRYINMLDTIRSRHRLKGREAGEIFSDIYRENAWENNESVSGDGSTLEYTANLRKELPGLFNRFSIKSILDAPCGDHNWFHLVDRGGRVQYTGGDIVPDLIRINNERFADAATSFIELDIIKDDLPDCDLWFCRDVLFHFSFADIFRTLENFVRSDINYLITTSHTKCTVNTDILTGQFRLLNLRLPPFELPEPLEGIDDWIKGFPERQMCLWDKASIQRALAKNRRSAIVSDSI